MLSLRAIFRFMLAAWFLAVGILAIFLGQHMQSRQAGALVEQMFSAPPTPPATAVLDTPRKRRVSPPITPQPVPAVEESGWTPLENARTSGEGTLGAPQFSVLPDKSLEVRLPYQGSLGGETHFTPRKAGIETRMDAISVDLHGKWNFRHQMDRHVQESVVCRVQIYPHPGQVRVSAISCLQESDAPTLAASVFFSDAQIRVLFSARP
jgi:hypothetical protein